MKKKRTREVLFMVFFVASCLLLLILAQGFNLFPARIRVDGISMEPALPKDTYLVVNRLAYIGREPERGDIIVFHFPSSPEQQYLKRVIGLPGDDIRVLEGVLTVNGAILNEPYVETAPVYRGAWSVPHDSLFVLGDNRNNSSDSHNWGWVQEEDVVGKAVFIYLPIDLSGPIEPPIYVGSAR